MSLTDQPAAYRDCYEVFARAISTPGGIRLPVDKREQSARFFQLRMNKARTIERAFSRRTYPSDHPLYDRSEYDGLQVQVRGPDPDGWWWIYVRPHGRMTLLAEIEPISDTEPEVLLEATKAERQQLTERRDRANLQIEHHQTIEGEPAVEPEPIDDGNSDL